MDEIDNKNVEEKSSWWYWFKKLDGNMAECNNCDWVKDRGPGFNLKIIFKFYTIDNFSKIHQHSKKPFALETQRIVHGEATS